MNLSFAITDVITDIMVLSMPCPCIRKLNMGRREKFGLTGIFLLGTLGTAASIVRLGFIGKAFSVDYGGSGNTHSSGTPPAVWATVEGAIGVLAACLPPLGPLIRKAPNPRKASVSTYHRLFSRSSGRKKSTSTFQTERKASTTKQAPMHFAQAHVVNTAEPPPQIESLRMSAREPVEEDIHNIADRQMV